MTRKNSISALCTTALYLGTIVPTILKIFATQLFFLFLNIGYCIRLFKAKKTEYTVAIQCSYDS